eukprot:scaffold8741_cov142-Skeletonema_menzelii.AAC.4
MGRGPKEGRRRGEGGVKMGRGPKEGRRRGEGGVKMGRGPKEGRGRPFVHPSFARPHLSFFTPSSIKATCLTNNYFSLQRGRERRPVTLYLTNPMTKKSGVRSSEAVNFEQKESVMIANSLDIAAMNEGNHISEHKRSVQEASG